MNWAIDGGHLIELLVAALTFFGIAWGFHRQDKKDNEERANRRENENKTAAELLEEKQEERHRENQRALGNISTQLEYNPPHVHVEPNGPLSVDGIRYGPKRKI